MSRAKKSQTLPRQRSIHDSSIILNVFRSPTTPWVLYSIAFNLLLPYTSIIIVIIISIIIIIVVVVTIIIGITPIRNFHCSYAMSPAQIYFNCSQLSAFSLTLTALSVLPLSQTPQQQTTNDHNCLHKFQHFPWCLLVISIKQYQHPTWQVQCRNIFLVFT